MSEPTAPQPRIAFVAGLATGGTASHLSALAAGCREAGLSVSVFGPARTLDLITASRPALDRFEVAITDRPRPAGDVRALAALRAGLAAWRPDVVHAHGVRAGAFAALARGLLRASARPALVVTVHNARPESGPARLVYARLERICARRADLVLCASADLVARMLRLGAKAEQFDVPAAAAPPPTAAAVAAARSELDAAGRPVVLTVGRLAPQKGLDVLIEAAARWRDRTPPPLTVIAGDGPLAAELRAQAAAAGADVRLLGRRDDVPALLAVADIVAVPSRWEARALVVQEAMRAGRPVVASRVGGIPELTGEDGGLLVPPGDPDALAVAVARILDDPELAGRLRRCGRERSADFASPAGALRTALALYAGLAAGNRLNRRH